MRNSSPPTEVRAKKMSSRFTEGEPLEFGDSAVKEALAQVKQTHERRALAYSVWKRAFKAVLDTKNEGGYLQACQVATSEFAACNGKMKQLVKLLDKIEGGDVWAYTITRLQQYEKSKFEFVILPSAFNSIMLSFNTFYF